MGEIIIRKYKKEDRQALRQIACDTAFMGEPCEAFFSDREVLADFLTRYFTDYEPQSCFVAQVNGNIAGYIVGTKDTNILERVFQIRILPLLITKMILRLTLLKKQNFKFICFLVLSLFRGELNAPKIFDAYPATLHVNLDANSRGKGIGSRLLDAYLEYLAQEKISGAHLSTLSEKAALFFEKHGFVLLRKKRRSYFRNILQKDIWCYTYTKSL